MTAGASKMLVMEPRIDANRKRRAMRRLALVLQIAACSGMAVQAQRSPFNGLDLLPVDSAGGYRILIGGHFHGESTNRSGYPASTLLANLDTINALGARLLISTGDLYMDREKDHPRYGHSFFSKLRMPLFNAPGNHDLKGAAGDESKELSRMTLGHDLVFILNTEVDDGSLSSQALEELSAVTEGEGPGRPRRVFIISHRPIWAEDDPLYADLFKENTRSLTGTNFNREVYPILLEVAKHAQVYWISGSLGGQAPSSIFFQKHAPNITYIQCAIRDEPRDALLIADVHADSVHWGALSLTGQRLHTPATYDAEWWRAQRGKGEGINWRMLPYEARKLLTHRAFWWGAAFALLLVFGVRRLWLRG